MDYSKIKNIRTIAFPVDLELTQGNWQSNQTNLSFNPDICIVKTIAYNEVVVEDSATDPNIYAIFCSLNNGMSCIGTFGAFGGTINATIDTNGGSIYNPNLTFIVKGMPISTMTFQIMIPGTTPDTWVNSNGATGDLIIIMEFIEFK